MASDKKILLMGLANAGKTSILLTLQRKTSIDKFQIGPTRSADWQRFGENNEYVVVDFGGQEFLVAEHLKKIDTYLDGATKLIFVIDIQDDDKLDDALDYLASVLGAIDRNAMSIPVLVFLHKYDRDEKELENLLSKRAEAIAQRIRSLQTSQEITIMKSSLSAMLSKLPV